MNTEQESATASAVETTTTKAADQPIAHTSNFGLLLLAGDPHGDVTEGASFPQFQVVAVHGLYGDRIKTWTTDGIGKAPGTSWMTEQIYNPHKEAQVWTYGYDASTSRSGICTKLEIRNKAFRLLDDLLEMRKKWQSKPIPLGFIAHDLGGTIVKEALMIASMQYFKYKNILQWTRLLMFFGCPHQCKSTENMGDNLARLLFSAVAPSLEDDSNPFMEIASKKVDNYFVRATKMGTTGILRELGWAVNEINGSFFASNMPSLLSIINIHSEEKDPALQVFREFTATMDVSYEERVGCAKPHTMLTKLSQEDQDKALRTRLNGKLKILYQDSPWEPGEISQEWLHTLRTLAAPTPPLVVPLGEQAQLDWILDHETYTNWLSNDGPGILHIHGTTYSSKAAKYLFQVLSDRNFASPSTEIPIFFSFDKHDDRRNSVLGMLNTVLAQIFSHNLILANRASVYVEDMTLGHSWSQEELIPILRVVIMSQNYRSTICVIDGFDECDESRMAFLKDFCYFSHVTERSWKIAFISRTKSDIQDILANCPTINLDENIDPENSKINLAYDIDVELMAFISQRPIYTGFKDNVRDMLAKIGEDDGHRGLAVKELIFGKCLYSEQAILDELEFLTKSSPKDIFKRILARIPHDRRPWARGALTWILYTFHPLTIRQLRIAVSTEINKLDEATSKGFDDRIYHSVHKDFAASLEEVFAGMFVVKNGEVHFGHPKARDFLLAADGEGQLWYDVKETAHKEISDTCLAYLSLPSARYSIHSNMNNTLQGQAWDSSVFIPRHDLSIYAVKYWPKHYKCIPETNRPTARAIEFIQNTDSMNWWAEAYWWFSNPISRRDRSFISRLPIFIELGLEDFWKDWPNLELTAAEIQKDRSLALVEAARNGQVDSIRLLLQFGGYSQSDLQEALVAGATRCDEASLIELITYAAKNIEKFEWSGVLICRAAQFNQESLVKRLLEVGASPDAVTTYALTALHIAGRDGYAGIVKILLDHGADFKLVSDSGRLPMHLAAYRGHTEIVKMLLNAGSEINILDTAKDNALHLACVCGNYGAIEVLLDAGADMGNEVVCKWSALTVVVDEGYVKSARLLVDRKANLEVEGPDNSTPLRYAALRGSLELCKLLIENGADVNTAKGGGPILNNPSNDGNLEIVKLFVENGARVNDANINGWNPLHNAAINGHVPTLTYLLDHNSDLSQKTGTGYNAFLLAVTSNYPKAAKLLIERGADVNAVDVDGWYPVQLAYNHAPTLRVLLENGANPNIVGDNSSALYLAAYYNKVDAAEALIPYKPDLEFTHPTGSGWTPLSAATLNGHSEIVRILLEAGANVDHKSDTGEAPLQYAVSINNENIVRIIMEFRPNLQLVDNVGNTALNSFANDGETSLSIIKLLINGGSDLEARNKARETPLCKAVRFEKPELIKYFISKKANLSAKGTWFGAPLHIACRWVNFELVEILVKAGADVDLVDDESAAGTPLQSACRGYAEENNYHEHEKIIRYLIEEGKADVTVVGGLQGCALNAACGWSSPDMVKLMLEHGAKIDVADRTGRVAIHFAASHTLEHFQPIQTAGADLEVVDKTGRTIVHWAVLSGRLDMLERVLSLSRGKVDQPDIDDWTPLMWAARGTGTFKNRATASMTEEVIKLLLDRGADPCVVGKGTDREWTPIKVARYHGLEPAIVDLLISKTKEKCEAEGKTFDDTFHAEKKTIRQVGSCDSCLAPMYGLAYECLTCLNIDFCYKCYRTRHLIHADHPFKASETEYEKVEEERKGSEESDDSDDDSDDSEGDDETGKIEETPVVNGVVENGVEKESDVDTEDEG